MGETGVPEPQEIPPEGQLGRGLNVRGAAKGATGPHHTPPARSQGELGTGKKGPRSFRNDLEKCPCIS